MANKKITQLPEVTSLASTDILVAVINPGTVPETKKIKLQNVLSGLPYVPSSHVGSGGAAHADVTTSVDGFMTAADKTKLNKIQIARAVSLPAGDGVNAVPNGAPIRIPVPFNMTLTYWFWNCSVAPVSGSANVQYYNGSAWSTICSVASTASTVLGGALNTELTKHTTSVQKLLQFNITGGTIKQATFTLVYNQTGD